MKDMNDHTNKDSVPAMLTPGEFVLNKEASQMYAPFIEQMNNHGLQQRHAENISMNMGGGVPPVQHLNFGGWLKGLLEPDEDSIIARQKRGELLPAHIRAVPPGYGAAPPPPPGGSAVSDEALLQGSSHAEQMGTGAQHGRNTVIPTSASMPYMKGEEAGMIPPIEEMHPRDRAMLANQAPENTGVANVHPRDAAMNYPGAVPPGFGAGPEGQAIGAVPPGFGAGPEGTAISATPPGYNESFGSATPPGFGAAPPQEGTGAQHGRDDIVTTNKYFDSDRDGSYFTKTNDPLLETEYPGAGNPGAVPAMFQGYADYTPEEAVAEAQGAVPETDNVDWNSLQGLGIPHAGPEADAVTDQVQDMVIQEQTNISDQIINKAQAQSTKLNAAAEAAAENGDFQEANRLRNKAKQTISDAETAKAEQDAKIAEIKDKYEKGRSARFDAENEWRESQGLPPKPAGLKTMDEVKNEVANKPLAKENVEATKEAVSSKVQELTANEPPLDDAEGNAVVTAGKNASPEVMDKAKAAVSDSFGDLFDKKEFNRAALIFAGALLTGMSPQRALAFAGQGYISRIDAKEAQAAKTAAQNSKDANALAIANAEREAKGQMTATGEAKEFWNDGKKVYGQEVKRKDPNTGIYTTSYVGPDGSILNPTEWTEDGKGSKTWRDNLKGTTDTTTKQLKELKETFGYNDPSDKTKGYKTDILPTTSAGKIAEWADQNGVDPAELSGLVESAYHETLNNPQKGKRARSIIPALEQLVIRQKTGDDAAWKTADGGNVDMQKIDILNAAASNKLKSLGFQGNATNLSNMFYGEALTDWNALGPDGQKQWNRKANKGENGFYLFTQDMLLNS